MSRPEPSVPARAAPPDPLLPWSSVRGLTGLSRTTAWRRWKAGDFPPPVVISPGRVGWRQSEVAAWQASRTRRGGRPAAAPQPAGAGGAAREGAPPPAAAPVAAAAAVRARTPPRPPRQLDFGF